MHARNIYACSQQITKIFKSNNGGFIQLEANAQKDCGILYLRKIRSLHDDWYDLSCIIVTSSLDHHRSSSPFPAVDPPFVTYRSTCSN